MWRRELGPGSESRRIAFDAVARHRALGRVAAGCGRRRSWPPSEDAGASLGGADRCMTTIPSAIVSESSWASTVIRSMIRTQPMDREEPRRTRSAPPPATGCGSRQSIQSGLSGRSGPGSRSDTAPIYSRGFERASTSSLARGGRTRKGSAASPVPSPSHVLPCRPPPPTPRTAAVFADAP